MPDKPAPAKEKPLCFVICPIGEPESETRKKSDKMMKHLIEKVLAPEYDILRADKIGRPGMITIQIVEALVDAELVIADLSDGNQNVYYELAIRHATKKPAIHIISAGQNASFDVQGMRFVPYDLTDLDVMEQAQKELGEHVKAIRQGEEVATPVQLAAIVRDLHSGKDRDAQISALFGNLNAGISSLRQDLADVMRAVRENNVMDMAKRDAARRTRELYSSALSGGGGTGLSNISTIAAIAAASQAAEDKGIPRLAERIRAVLEREEEAKAKEERQKEQHESNRAHVPRPKSK